MAFSQDGVAFDPDDTVVSNNGRTPRPPNGWNRLDQEDLDKVNRAGEQTTDLFRDRFHKERLAAAQDDLITQRFAFEKANLSGGGAGDDMVELSNNLDREARERLVKTGQTIPDWMDNMAEKGRRYCPDIFRKAGREVAQWGGKKLLLHGCPMLWAPAAVDDLNDAKNASLFTLDFLFGEGRDQVHENPDLATKEYNPELGYNPQLQPQY